MLEKFRQAKQAEIARLRRLRDNGAEFAPYGGLRPSFSQALLRTSGLAVIAEYKRASPSKGDINPGLSPEAVAQGYARGGAHALSVLTEEAYFKGSLEFIERMRCANLPMLRKDFLVDPLQVAQTAAYPVSALLLIARMLTAGELAEMLEETNRCCLEAVVEVFDEADLAKAREAGPRILQVNNRDLDRLTTDLDVSRRLAQQKRPEEIWISASGVSRPEDLRRIRGWGYNAVLVGTSLMAEADPGQALARLLADQQKGVEP